MIRLYKTEKEIVVQYQERCFLTGRHDWDVFINRDNVYETLLREIAEFIPVENPKWLEAQKLYAPIGTQEVWAAGVTYLRSKTARMEESRESGGATFYDKVYDAERPELFFKAAHYRVAGPGDFVRVRKDSTWDVPEPELTLVINSSGNIIGYTIGNDMSSRSIEGENPLYLPQAKIYDGSAAIGPCVLLTEQAIPSTTEIIMKVERDGLAVFEGRTTISLMKRKHEELAEFLFREISFPNGCYLMTGTCVVPDNDFTLRSADVVTIKIDNIGTLVNTVE